MPSFPKDKYMSLVKDGEKGQIVMPKDAGRQITRHSYTAATRSRKNT